MKQNWLNFSRTLIYYWFLLVGDGPWYGLWCHLPVILCHFPILRLIAVASCSVICLGSDLMLHVMQPLV